MRLALLTYATAISIAAITSPVSAGSARPAFRNGPVVGHTGETFVTVSCRMSVECEAFIKINGKTYESKKALIHNFRIEGLKPGTSYTYSLHVKQSPAADISAGPFTVKTYPHYDPGNKGYELVFAALGDSRNNPKVWRKVTDRLAELGVSFVIHTGDLVGNGSKDAEWDDQVFTPAKKMLSSIPMYPVYGNHERGAAVLLDMFQMPGNARDWTQTIGPVLLMGVDGSGKSFARGGKKGKWLEEQLASSRAKFIFLASHYPAWSSGPHGSDRGAQEHIIPLLDKYKAAAMIAGHDHCYERSERESGVVCLTLGGAGAPPYGKSKDAAEKNPHSKLFLRTHHYGICTIRDDTCALVVYDLNDKEIDRRMWSSRLSPTSTVQKTPVGKPKPDATPTPAAAPKVKVPEELLAEWRGKLIQRIAAAAKVGKPLKGAVHVGGKSEVYPLVGADEKELRVQIQGNAMPVRWSWLKPPHLANLVKSFVKDGDAEGQLMLGVFLIASGRAADGEQALARAALLDAPAAAKVREGLK